MLSVINFDLTNIVM